MATGRLRILIASSGIAGFGVIVGEVLKKWQLIDAAASILWVICPILLLFWCNELLHSAFLRKQEKIRPLTYRVLTRTIKALLLIGFLVLVASVPFLWYGAIKELAVKAR